MAAPFVTNGWELALTAMASLTRSNSGQIIGIGPTRALAFNRITNLADPALTAQFDADAVNYSSGNWRVGAVAGAFDIRHEHHYEEVKATTRTDTYDGFCHDSNMPFGCQTVLLDQPEIMIGLATLRTYEDGVSTEQDRAAFAQVAPFALAAVRMQRSLEEQGAKLIAGALGAMTSATFICDRRAAVRAMTAPAEQLVNTGKLITVRAKQLIASSPAENRQLQGILSAMVQTAETAAPYRSMWLGMNLPIRDRRLCEFFPLPAHEPGFDLGPFFLVTVRAAGNIAATEREALRTMIGLTSAEAEVVMMLSEGTPRDGIAARRGTSHNTVTTQIKRIFEKAGVTREAELVALVGRLLR